MINKTDTYAYTNNSEMATMPEYAGIIYDTKYKQTFLAIEDI